MRFLEKLSYGFDTLLMPSERLGEMFEVYFADMCAKKFLKDILTSINNGSVAML